MPWPRANQVVQAAIQDRATPGACFAIGFATSGYVACHGRLSYEPDALPTSPETLWDLASLTKVVGTTTAAMLLFGSGDLDLDQSVSDLLPEFRHSGVTVRNLLLHNSGLAASHPSPADFREPDALIESILSQSLVYETGEQTIYSDLGFIVLGRFLERVAGEPLDRFLQTNVWSTLGMTATGFRPQARDSTCAPTERVEPWRRDLRRRRGQPNAADEWIVAEVHDPTAMILGGGAGHAGLFSTIEDLTIFMRALTRRHESLVNPSTLELFITKPHLAESSRALGWDTPSEGSSAGNLFGPRSFGHTGFTGTSIWADPDRQLFAILLTNRVHPTADNLKIRDLRRSFHDAVVEDLLDSDR